MFKRNVLEVIDNIDGGTEVVRVPQWSTTGLHSYLGSLCQRKDYEQKNLFLFSKIEK